MTLFEEPAPKVDATAPAADCPGDALPLSGIRVVDFGHTVMGPCCSMLLADLGAEIIKIEPALGGDPTRNLRGFGMGYFGYFNRNKKSLAVDLKSEQGREIVCKLLATADVLVENFGPGTMDRLGLDYGSVAEMNPGIVYCELKGFMAGPYENRPALDEIVQMMSGLAYMTGPVGQPLRAGTSVVDIVGGMFGMLGVLLALKERDQTGKGKHVKATLFETAVFLMGQHLCYASLSSEPVPPMPARTSAWSIYEIFQTADDQSLFVGIISDRHWERFCAEFELLYLFQREDLRTNNARIAARPTLVPEVMRVVRTLTLQDAAARLERAGIPFAPVSRPEDLFEDRHLQATGNLQDSRLPDGRSIRTPRLPLQYGGWHPGLRSEPPAIGASTEGMLDELGYSAAEIDKLLNLGVVR